MEFKKLSYNQLEIAADMLKAIAHPIRFAIISKLEKGNQLTVTQIYNELKIEQSTASHHLGILKNKGIVIAKRKGKNINYSLKYDTVSTIVGCISQCVCK